MNEFIQEYIIPLHPKLTDLPVALFVTALGLEVLSRVLKREDWHKFSFLLYILAIMSLPVVAAAGFWEEYRRHLHHHVLDEHKCAAFLTTGIAVFSLPFLWFIKKKAPPYFRSTFLLFLIVLTVCIVITAHYGGEMVFKYAVGVEN